MGIAIKKDDLCTADCTMQTILSMLDEGIADLENGRVLSAEEVWKELDSI